MISVDEQVIEEAYREQLKKLFFQFFINIVDAMDRPEETFTRGVKMLRDARSRATSAVRQQ